MYDIEKLCFNCFHEKDNTGSCPYCGYSNIDNTTKFPGAIKNGSILNGQYIVGRVLGQGGFGITYLALDYHLELKVAVKEYLPEGMAARLPGTTLVSVYEGEKQDNFNYGAERFLDEAKVLAKFLGNKNIVSVKSYFRENNTAYFVMDYIEGINFKSYIKNHGGKIDYQEALRVLLPVIDALFLVHREGFIHRDVTPDNIYLTKDNEIKLLDFGSARYSLGDKSKSLDVILKAGYAPKEQYIRKGKQGPFTDIYSLAACFYASITGFLPPESLERLDNDEIISISARGILIPRQMEMAVMKGLAVRAEDRFQNIEDFKTALLSDVNPNKYNYSNHIRYEQPVVNPLYELAPIVMPIVMPIVTPIATPIVTPIETPMATPISTPIPTPINDADNIQNRDMQQSSRPISSTISELAQVKSEISNEIITSSAPEEVKKVSESDLQSVLGPNNKKNIESKSQILSDTESRFLINKKTSHKKNNAFVRFLQDKRNIALLSVACLLIVIITLGAFAIILGQNDTIKVNVDKGETSGSKDGNGNQSNIVPPTIAQLKQEETLQFLIDPDLAKFNSTITELSKTMSQPIEIRQTSSKEEFISLTQENIQNKKMSISFGYKSDDFINDEIDNGVNVKESTISDVYYVVTETEDSVATYIIGILKPAEEKIAADQKAKDITENEEAATATKAAEEEAAALTKAAEKEEATALTKAAEKAKSAAATKAAEKKEAAATKAAEEARKCSYCHGTGKVECTWCDGTGICKIAHWTDDGEEYIYVGNPCPKKITCSWCDGTGEK